MSTIPYAGAAVQPEESARIAQALKHLQAVAPRGVHAAVKAWDGQKAGGWFSAEALADLAADAVRRRWATAEADVQAVYITACDHDPDVDPWHRKENTAVALRAFWCDLDCIGPAHPSATVTVQGALHALGAFPVPPTAIVATGNGAQAWWTLTESLPLPDAQARARAKALLGGWTAALQAHGVPVDGAAGKSLAALLRLAGTANRKPKCAEAYATLVSADGPRHTLADLEAFATVGHCPVAPAQEGAPAGATAPVSWQDYGPTPEAVLDLAAAPVEVGRRSELRGSCACALVAQDRDDAEIVAMLRSSPWALEGHADEAQFAVREVAYAHEYVEERRAAEARELCISSPTAAVPFPLEVLPSEVQSYVAEAAAALQCPPDYVAVPLLTVAGAAIGASVRVVLKEGWVERPFLYTAIVGLPGDGKSPALAVVSQPVRDAQQKAAHAYEAAYQEWQAAQDKKNAGLPPPFLARYWTADTTTEALAPLLRDHDRGIIMLRDELSSWVAQMDQYRKGRGGDRQFYLSAWSGASIAVDRKGGDDKGRKGVPILVGRPALAVTGALVPDKLQALRDEAGASDGFVDRLLLSYPDRLPTGGWTEEALRAATQRVWEETYARLRTWPDRTLTMTPAAHELWVAEFNAHRKRKDHPDTPESLRGTLTKLESYAGRFIVILHCLQDAGDYTPVVCSSTVGGAWRLVAYFAEHATRCLYRMEASPEERGAEAALRWLRARGGNATATEIKDAKAGGRTHPERRAVWTALVAGGAVTVGVQGRTTVYALAGGAA